MTRTERRARRGVRVAMRILGIGDCLELGPLYLALAREGHEVRAWMGDASHRGTYGGLLAPVADWRAELDWVGRDGLILFETVGQGEIQDQLRSDGFRVIGGGKFGDRLELDRAYGQRVLREAGLDVADWHRFDDAGAAASYLAAHPGRYVLKSDEASIATRVGLLAGGEDLLFALAHPPYGSDGGAVHLMQHLAGIEIGTGAFFDGRDFVRPACLDFEHKHFFPGERGEMTGEMGTLVTYDGAERFFDATLARLAQHFAAAGHVGWVNLNCIVDEGRIRPLEFTCRFGYPGFAALAPLQRDGWGALLQRVATGGTDMHRTQHGWSVAIVLTIPPFPHGVAGTDPADDPPIFVTAPIDPKHLHWIDVRSVGEHLFARRRTGYVAVVTGIGATIDAARHLAASHAERVVVEDIRWRDDIGLRVRRGEASRLRQAGWL